VSSVIAYTDGAARGNPGPGGFGVVLIWNQHHREISKGFRKTTNNRMELLAVITALEALKFEGTEIQIFSDSKYVVDAVNQNWIGSWQRKGFNKIKNPDLWKRFLQIYPKHKVRFTWIKGHNGHPLNERADQLAVEASLQINLEPDAFYESLGGDPLFGRD
jgi:ribonuclease HI